MNLIMTAVISLALGYWLKPPFLGGFAIGVLVYMVVDIWSRGARR